MSQEQHKVIFNIYLPTLQDNRLSYIVAIAEISAPTKLYICKTTLINQSDYNLYSCETNVESPITDFKIIVEIIKEYGEYAGGDSYIYGRWSTSMKFIVKQICKEIHCDKPYLTAEEQEFQHMNQQGQITRPAIQKKILVLEGQKSPGSPKPERRNIYKPNIPKLAKGIEKPYRSSNDVIKALLDAN